MKIVTLNGLTLDPGEYAFDEECNELQFHCNSLLEEEDIVQIIDTKKHTRKVILISDSTAHKVYDIIYLGSFEIKEVKE